MGRPGRDRGCHLASGFAPGEFEDAGDLQDGEVLPGVTFLAQSKRGRQADLKYCDLAGLDFSGVNFAGADFTGADLTGTTFTGATLKSAVFTGAMMQRTDLTGAMLDGATMSGLDLASVVWGARVSLPARISRAAC